ncbi:hypothetical protein [Streptomyces collinus]|uniref:hypothetical protein n=1 Tax=Streptomyces collinus TaxID=42684 RepID=UPI0033D73BBA
MSESTARATELTTQYVDQVAADLERNVKEQDRVAAELAALQEQLVALQHDHTVLVNMQQALGLVVPAAAPRPVHDDGAVVPSPRKKTAGTATAERSPAKKATTAKATATKSPAEKSAPAKAPADKATATKTPADKAPADEAPADKATATVTATKATTDKATTAKAPAAKSTAKRAPARKTTANKTANKPAGKKATGGATAAKPTRPTLIELVLKHLTEQQEPRSAAEVTQALDREHPGRGVQATVVRTSLENLVAKNKAQRTKQGTSVFYTAGAVTD